MSYRFLSTLLLCSAGAFSLLAQDAAPKLSLEDAEAMALKNHPQILASEASYRRADEVVTQNRAAYYPALNGEITAAQANENSRLGAGVLNAPGLFSHFGSGLALSQLI